jgi:hypothetical protein
MANMDTNLRAVLATDAATALLQPPRQIPAGSERGWSAILLLLATSSPGKAVGR